MAVRHMTTPVVMTALFAATGCSLSAANEPPNRPSQLDSTSQERCAMQIDFSDPDAVTPWRIVNDGVMGGKSQGTRFAEDGNMVFRGVINTNGGGFSSLRRDMEPGDLSGAGAIRLRVRADGRDYKMTFRTSERWRGRSVSYQVAIPSSPDGDWSEVTVPLADMNTSVFGRDVRAAPFDPSDVREMGIIIADGVDGPFRFEVKTMGCVPGG